MSAEAQLEAYDESGQIGSDGNQRDSLNPAVTVPRLQPETLRLANQVLDRLLFPSRSGQPTLELVSGQRLYVPDQILGRDRLQRCSHLSFPLIALTLGLFTVVVNAFLLQVTDALTKNLTVDGFWPSVLGALVISIVSWALSIFVPDV